jgi:two-component system phosphate regulon sensor histidine kinase PhoR
VQVTDNGPGIPREDQEHIFERFYRVHKDRSRETGGTGLGLAIVKYALSHHQARMEIDSEPEQGSTFSAIFPARRTFQAQVAATATA